MVTTDGIKLTTGCQTFVLELIQNGGTDKRSLKMDPVGFEEKVIQVSDEEPFEDDCNDDNDELWVTLKTVKLRMSNKEILTNANGLLNDKHIKCAQSLIKSKLPNIGGLQSTLLQQKKVTPLERKSFISQDTRLLLQQ